MRDMSYFSNEYKCIEPLGMCFILGVAVYLFYRGISGNAYASIYGTQARIHIALFILLLSYLYFHKMKKTYLKTYRIFICSAIFVVLMFLGYLYFSWWHPLAAIPLTILWYPLHRRILKGLPRNEMERDAGNEEKLS